MSEYYFVLQSLHKPLPSIALYCKAFTKYVPVLLCTTKLAQSTSQYEFVLHAAETPSNLDAAITMRSADTDLQNTIELRELSATVSEIAAPKPDLDATAQKNTVSSTWLKEF